MNFDPHIFWAIGVYSREEMLRAAAAERLAAQLPHQPSALRLRAARWLHALADQLAPLPGMQPAR